MLALKLPDSCQCRAGHQDKQGPLSHSTAAIPVRAPMMASPQLHMDVLLASNAEIAYMGKYCMAIYGIDLASFH